jgi:hypothetical protein
MAETILAVNAGSSSIKLSLYETDGRCTLSLAFAGQLDGSRFPGTPQVRMIAEHTLEIVTPALAAGPSPRTGHESLAAAMKGAKDP